MLAGDPEAAEVALRGGIEALRGIGETGFASTLIGHLGAALYALERYDEAYAATTMCEEAAAKDDIDPQIHWRRVRAKLFAREGKRAEAEALAREALELVSGTDLIDVHAIALMDQAEVYRLTGREEERTPPCPMLLDSASSVATSSERAGPRRLGRDLKVVRVAVDLLQLLDAVDVGPGLGELDLLPRRAPAVDVALAGVVGGERELLVVVLAQ